MSEPVSAKRKAVLIVRGIVRDLSDRCGLGNEWEEIDDDIRREIVHVWRKIALDVIEGTVTHE